MKNFFIAFEGIDGTGKTTHSAYLEHVLEERGFEVFYYHKIPSRGGWFLDGIAYENNKNTREYYGDYAVSLVEAIDRVNNINGYVKPLLDNPKKNIAIIAEKYNYGYLAKDSRRLKSGEFNIIKGIYDKAIKPDCIIYLDLEPGQAVDRINGRGYGYENESDLSEFRKAYESLDEYGDFVIVNTNNSIKEVDEKIAEIVDQFIDSSM